MMKSSDDTYRSVYAAHDLQICAGVNGGEPAGHAEDSFAGDVYQLMPNAARLDISTSAEPLQNPLAYDLYLDDRFGPERPSSTFLGHLGRDLCPVSRLRLMGPAGDLVEVVTLNNIAPNAERGPIFAASTFFMPLSPMKSGVEYVLIEAMTSPEAPQENADFEGQFGRGTHIRLEDGGDILVELLRPGMVLETREGFGVELRDITSAKVDMSGPEAPVVLPRGLFSNAADLVVSPRQSILISDWRAEVMLGTKDIALCAGDLALNPAPGQTGLREMYELRLAEAATVYADNQPCPIAGSESAATLAYQRPKDVPNFLRQSGLLTQSQ